MSIVKDPNFRDALVNFYRNAIYFTPQPDALMLYSCKEISVIYENTGYYFTTTYSGYLLQYIELPNSSSMYAILEVGAHFGTYVCTHNNVVQYMRSKKHWHHYSRIIPGHIFEYITEINIGHAFYVKKGDTIDTVYKLYSLGALNVCKKPITPAPPPIKNTNKSYLLEYNKKEQQLYSIDEHSSGPFDTFGF